VLALGIVKWNRK